MHSAKDWDGRHNFTLLPPTTELDDGCSYRLHTGRVYVIMYHFPLRILLFSGSPYCSVASTSISIYSFPPAPSLLAPCPSTSSPFPSVLFPSYSYACSFPSPPSVVHLIPNTYHRQERHGWERARIVAALLPTAELLFKVDQSRLHVSN